MQKNRQILQILSKVYGGKKMIINKEEKLVQIKIVYYGCAMSGKTTSLRNLFKNFALEKNLTSIETTTGRTLFFDYGVIALNGGEWKVKIGIYSATGQDFYASTRPATLAGADGILFIIDSQKKYFKDNWESWKELKQFYGNKISRIPIIFCLNKQDLPDLIEINTIIEHFNLHSLQKIDIVQTSALNGTGPITAFKKMLSFFFPAIKISN